MTVDFRAARVITSSLPAQYAMPLRSEPRLHGDNPRFYRDSLPGARLGLLALEDVRDDGSRSHVDAGPVEEGEDRATRGGRGLQSVTPGNRAARGGSSRGRDRDGFALGEF